MKNEEYLDRLLLKYSNNFNIYIPYRIGAKEYPAYGYFFSHNERYILVKEANMWSMDSFEHVIFMTVTEVTELILSEAKELISEYMEKDLVRQGQKYPGKNHMSSILTVIIVAEKELSRDMERQIRRYRFDKGYQCNLRGFSRGRIVISDMEKECVTASSQGKNIKVLLKQVFQDLKEGKPGFAEACAIQGITPFSQEHQTI